MLLSIVIPVYNTKEYLESCVQSVLACDCQDCEIILVDDGATDGVCPQMCDRLAAENPQLIRVIHQENKGLGGARNTGLEAAKGTYVFFPDSDDTVTPNTLTVLKKAIADTGADIISFNFYSDDGEGHLTPLKSNYFEADAPFRLADRPEFLLSAPSAWSRVWKRSLFMDSGVRYPSRVWYEDLRTSMKLFALADSIATIPDHLYLYLQRPGSIMHSAKIDRNREIQEAMEDLLLWFKENGFYEQYRPQLCHLCLDHVYLTASVRVLRVDPKHPMLNEFRTYLLEQFPDYKKSPYLSDLSASRKLAYHLLNLRCYKLLNLLFRINDRRS